MSLRLIPATAEDLSKVVALQQAAYARNRRILGVEPQPLTADYAAVIRDYEVWLAEVDDVLAGVLILEPRADDLLVWSIAVAPEQQGRGLGNRLLAMAEGRTSELGLRSMRLYTGERLEGNVSWYERHGFARERVEHRHDRSVVHMVKWVG